MRKDIVKIWVGVVILIVFGFFHQTQAIGESFTIEISPDNPGPNAKISAKIVSYSFDVDRANISWFVNGAKKLSGKGEKSFSFNIGEIGSKTTLVASIVTDQGITVEKSLTFRPAGLDILWEADNYTPPSYRGKALLSSESRIKITAFPEFIYNGEKISPSNLIYDWEINSKKKIDMSGYGKRTISYKLSSLSREENIKVTVSSSNKTIVAEKTIKLATTAPKIVFYQENLLEGPQYNVAFNKETDLSGDGVSVRAEPYFFSNSHLKQLTYQWKMNNKAIESGEKNNVIDFRRDSGESGSALIILDIQNPISILQSAINNLKINFGL